MGKGGIDCDSLRTNPRSNDTVAPLEKHFPVKHSPQSSKHKFCSKSGAVLRKVLLSSNASGCKMRKETCQGQEKPTSLVLAPNCCSAVTVRLHQKLLFESKLNASFIFIFFFVCTNMKPVKYLLSAWLLCQQMTHRQILLRFLPFKQEFHWVLTATIRLTYGEPSGFVIIVVFSDGCCWLEKILQDLCFLEKAEFLRSQGRKEFGVQHTCNQKWRQPTQDLVKD